MDTRVAEKADEVLARYEEIVLSEQDYEQFVAIMTSESEPTDIAKREAAEFKAWKVD